MAKYTKSKGNSSPQGQAFKVFEYASKKVPAYKKFLRSYGINAKSVLKNKDFEAIPVMSKDNYLRAYKPLLLIPEGKFPPMISASSGSSGKLFYWPRGDKQETWGGEMHRIILEDLFNLKKKKILVIVCFSMGNWIAGTFSLASLREVARHSKHLNITITTPGIDKDDAIMILRDLAPSFDSVVLMGYPPFVMDVLLEAKESGVNLKKFDLHFILAGENFSERWREMLLRVAGVSGNNRVISIYGTADAGPLGHENPLTIAIRRLAAKNRLFKKELFGETNFLPTVVSYYSKNIFFESENGELLFTTLAGIPLVRYNIKDHGLILSVSYIRSILKKYNLEKGMLKDLKRWNNPIVVLKGRNDVSVTFYALNIYPENLKAGLEDRKISRLVTGKYVARTEQSKDFRQQKLFIEVELKKHITPSKKLKKLVLDSVVQHLTDLNTEYRKLFNSIHKRALPEIILIKHGHEQFVVKKAKHRWVSKKNK